MARVQSPDRLSALAAAAAQHGLGTLVEVHTAAELEAALAVRPTAVGVNARDLGTFTVDLRYAEEIIARVPAHIPPVAASGAQGRGDVERLAAPGAHFVLAGT